MYTDIYFQDGGNGYITDDSVIHIISCPNCKLENYVMNVSYGPCCWCGCDGENFLYTKIQ